MKLRTVISLFLLTASVVAAQTAQDLFAPEANTKSKSGQFVVFGPPGVSTPLNRAMRTQAKDVLRLDRATTAVSAERVKDALFQELGVRDRYARLAAPRPLEPGRITINIARGNREPIRVGRLPVQGGWTYRLDLPLQMTAHNFDSALSQVLLVDLAAPTNDAPVDLPLWLSAGLLAHIEESATQPLFLDPGLDARIESRGESLEQRNTKRFRNVFMSRSALSFDELSWPGSVEADETGLFVPSAQFFVYRLLQLPDGRDCLRSMIQKLSNHRNWQFAFHDAFSGHFKEPKDVERWWAIQLAALAGRDPGKLWPLSLSLERIDEVLRVPVQIQFTGIRPPETSTLTLQRAVEQWDLTREQVLLRRVIVDLGTLRNRVSQDAVDLVDAYRQAISDYLEGRDPMKWMGRNKAGTQTSAIFEQKELQRRLDRLDTERETLRQKSVVELTLHEAERRVAVTNALSRADGPAGRGR